MTKNQRNCLGKVLEALACLRDVPFWKVVSVYGHCPDSFSPLPLCQTSTLGHLFPRRRFFLSRCPSQLGKRWSPSLNPPPPPPPPTPHPHYALEGGQFRFWSNLKVPFYVNLWHKSVIWDISSHIWSIKKQIFGFKFSRNGPQKQKKIENEQNSQFWACFSVFE